MPHLPAPSSADDPEVPLVGNVGGAVRVGRTVRRPVGPWTPAVDTLLRHLAPRLDCVPRVHGFDAAGREVLDYLPGAVVDVDSVRLTDEQLESLVAWTGRFHRAVRSFHHDGPWRCFPRADVSIIGHNDLGPYNCCFDGNSLAGVFDWDLAGPSTPLAELAFIAWNGVPLTRPAHPGEEARRLRLIAAAYPGRFTAREILQAVPGRVQLMLDGIPRAAAAGDVGMQNLMKAGEPQRSQPVLDAVRARLATVSALC